jgi:simple sugar transport system substrate-binding protein
MVASGVKGIAITPTSPAVIPALTKAVKSGVKVVLMDNDLPTWKLKTSVVATNNLKGGVLAGQWLAGKLKAGDTLGILEGVPGVPALDDRVTGMLNGLGALKSSIKVVSKLETDCDQTKGAQAAQTMLTANPSLTAIYSACGPPALGAIQSIKNAGIKPGGIILVGFDGLPDELTAVKAGTESATVQQHPVKIGSLGIATLYSAVQGKKVPKNVDTGTGIVTG